MNLSSQWTRHVVRGGGETQRLTSFSGSAMVNYYVRDFSFRAYMVSPSLNLIDSQIHRKSFWQYQLSAMWSHGNWILEANANNLFVKKNKIEEELSSSCYSFRQTIQSRGFRSRATLKIVYSLDYGKKTSKTPNYEHMDSESAILKKRNICP